MRSALSQTFAGSPSVHGRVASATRPIQPGCQARTAHTDHITALALYFHRACHVDLGVATSQLGQSQAVRLHVTRFYEYCALVEDRLVPKYGAAEHWAKIEVDHLDRRAAQERLARR